MPVDAPSASFIERLVALRRASRRLGSRRGMSLVEIMVVIMIIVTLMSAVGYGAISTYQQAMADTTSMTLGQINSKVEIYMLRHKKPPPQGQGLRAVYDGEEPPKDGWGNPIQYVTPGPGRMKFDLISLGADGKEGGTGTDADLRWSKASR
jgi:general secretion pathway protein G